LSTQQARNSPLPVLLFGALLHLPFPYSRQIRHSCQPFECSSKQIKPRVSTLHPPRPLAPISLSSNLSRLQWLRRRYHSSQPLLLHIPSIILKRNPAPPYIPVPRHQTSHRLLLDSHNTHHICPRILDNCALRNHLCMYRPFCDLRILPSAPERRLLKVCMAVLMTRAI